MRLQQALFTSVQNRDIQGYQLVAQSSGLPSQLVPSIVRWSPSHAGLATGVTPPSWNFHALSDDAFAVSRTVYGGPEYSSRGGWQLVTKIVVADRRQFAAYENNALRLLETLAAEGVLAFRFPIPNELPEVDVPDRPVGPAFEQTVTETCREVLSAVNAGQRVVVVDSQSPTDIVRSVLNATPMSQRAELSFTTGLRPSLNRPFFLQFLPSLSGNESYLRQQDVTVVRADSTASVSAI